MIYLQAQKKFMYHIDRVDRRGRHYTQYYVILDGELLTLCQAIQSFNLTLTDIFHKYPLNVVRINRRYTYHNDAGRRFPKGFHNLTFLS